MEFDHRQLSIVRQCELLDLPRSSVYYAPVGETAANLQLMRAIDRQYVATPFYGSRRMAVELVPQISPRAASSTIASPKVSRTVEAIGAVRMGRTNTL